MELGHGQGSGLSRQHKGSCNCCAAALRPFPLFLRCTTLLPVSKHLSHLFLFRLNHQATALSSPLSVIPLFSFSSLPKRAIPFHSAPDPFVLGLVHMVIPKTTSSMTTQPPSNDLALQMELHGKWKLQLNRRKKSLLSSILQTSTLIFFLKILFIAAELSLCISSIIY